MMQRQPLLIFLISIFCLSAAFVLRRTIYESIIVPLAYVWWWLTLLYHLLPQLSIWVVLLFVVLFTTVREVLLEFPLKRDIQIKRKKYTGPVENLSLLIHKTRQGNYYRWLIANRLGNAARELLDQREARQIKQKFSRLDGRGWNPPEDVSAYLESGVNGSFADYPYRRWSRAPRTPLDLNPQHVIEYLESEMENNRNGHR